MADEGILQKMYEHSKMETSYGEEYVVRGAKVVCSSGKGSCVLNVPGGTRTTTQDNRPLISINDTKTENISGFEFCFAHNEECSPNFGQWYNGVDGLKEVYDSNHKSFGSAVIVGAEAQCGRGGRIKIMTSGQTIPDYEGDFIDGVDMYEDVKASWSMRKSFLGHFHPEHSGVYNLGIHVDNSVAPITGSVFVYQSNWILLKKYLVYEGAYEFKEYSDSLKFDSEQILHSITDGDSYFEKWTTWVDLVLDKGVNYYIEIDCPGVYNYSYKLIGNLDKKNDSECAFAYWKVDKNYTDDHPYNYYKLVAYENNVKTIPFKIYMNFVCMKILRPKLAEKVYNEEHSIKQKEKDITNTVITTAVGSIGPKIGILVTVLDLLLKMSKSDIEKIISLIDKYLNKSLPVDQKGMVLTFYDLTCGGFFPEYQIKDDIWNKDSIEGYKYIIGQFETIDENQKLVDAYNEIEDFENDVKDIMD